MAKVMKKTLIIIFFLALANGLSAELDWKKGVQMDVRPVDVGPEYLNKDVIRLKDGRIIKLRRYIQEYPDRVIIQTEYNTKYDPFLTGLEYKTNYSIEKFTNNKIVINTTITTYRRYIIISIILLSVCIIILGFIINRIRRRNK